LGLNEADTFRSSSILISLKHRASNLYRKKLA
jgi:hypothetical protein